MLKSSVSKSSASKAESTNQKKARVEKILERFFSSNPAPKCELHFHTPYQLLVSVVLSAQATDKSVNAAMTDLYDHGLSPGDVLKMGEIGFLEKIRKIGLAPTKAKNVIKLTEIIHTKYSDQIPTTREELEALPGVGRKTANVILGEIFKEPTLAVDTHVYRVTARLGLHKESTPEKSEPVILNLIDKKWLPMAHHWFILHGRYTCLARSPKCGECKIADLCSKIF
jgi:endonuclease-3